MGVSYCSMFCCTLLYVHSSMAIILMGKRELVALLNLSSWCLVIVEWLFLAVPRGCLQFVIVVFPHPTHLLFLTQQEVANRHLTDRESYKKCYNEYHIHLLIWIKKSLLCLQSNESSGSKYSLSNFFVFSTLAFSIFAAW